MQAPKPIDLLPFLNRRPDADDPRLAELSTPPGDSNGVVILGYPDDEGIQLNGGRVGAHAGPGEIRRALYRMTPHPRRPLKAFWDLGDADAKGLDLSARHEAGRDLVQDSLRAGHQVLSLGGGNDYSYADGMGFLDQNFAKKPLIINIDAHLDVRNLDKGLTSGTPFFRLLESGVEFDFLEIGIQSQCNSARHWEYVERKNGRILSLEEILDSRLTLIDFVTQAAGDWLLTKRPTYLSVDMDAFAWPYAQGTSAAWPLGLDPHQSFSLFQFLFRRLDVRVMGLYEVSPPLDHGGGTARLAAQFAHGFLHHV